MLPLKQNDSYKSLLKQNTSDAFDGGEKKILLLDSTIDNIEECCKFIEIYRRELSNFIPMVSVLETNQTSFDYRNFFKNIPIGQNNSIGGEFCIQNSTGFSKDSLRNITTCIQDFDNLEQIQKVKAATMEGKRVYPIIKPEFVEQSYVDNTEIQPIPGDIMKSKIFPRYILDFSDNQYNLGQVAKILVNKYRSRCLQGIKLNSNTTPEELIQQIRNISTIILGNRNIPNTA